LHLDIKPQNLIVLAPGDLIKLIDYGGCIIEGKPGKPIATEGYNAPELVPADPINRSRLRGPCKASDVFSLGRLFCFLSLPFSLIGKYRYTLPSPAEVAVFGEMESVYRFVRRLTAINPDERMTLSEAHEAAYALRNEVMALKQRRAMPSPSSIFLPDASKEAVLSFRTIPELCVDPKDDAAQQVALALAEPNLDQQRELLEKAVAEFPNSREGLMRLAALASDRGDFEFARRTLDQVMKQHPFDWRIVYYLGRLHGITGDTEQAARCFDACYSACPAEVAIKLANGLCAERLGQNAMASRFYETASWVNPQYIAGPFGWARCASHAQDWATAIEAYSRVPRTSWAFNQALIGRVQALIQILSGAAAKGIGLNELQEAASAANCVLAEGDSYDGFRVKADVLKAAIAALQSGALKADKTILLLGVPLIQGRLRDAASQALKQSALNVNDPDLRIELVDEARRVGRITLFGGK
jgi:serine/threonine-protein kinase PknG